jgi:hypothetical protein
MHLLMTLASAAALFALVALPLSEATAQGVRFARTADQMGDRRMPSNHSARTLADDQLPIAAYATRHLTTDQLQTIRGAIANTPEGSGSRALDGYAEIGAIVPTAALGGMHELPPTVSPLLRVICKLYFDDKSRTARRLGETGWAASVQAICGADQAGCRG